MDYLAKFDSNSVRLTSVVAGVHFNTPEQRQSYLDDGYVPITDDEQAYYIGNRGPGDNGTGYIRDSVTGKPVSAPPYVPTPEEQANTAAMEYEAQIKELNTAIVVAQADGDAELVQDLQTEKAALLTEYQTKLEAITNG